MNTVVGRCDNLKIAKYGLVNTSAITNKFWTFNIVTHPYYRESTQAEKRSRTITVSLYTNTPNVEIQMHNNAAPFQICADIVSDDQRQ